MKIRSNAWKHLKTITEHRHMVIYHCQKAGILWQGLFHDLSKYMPSELLVGIKYYQGDKSPNEGERVDYGYSKAWMHHKGRNRHHFEYWTDYNIKTRKLSPVEMPLNYIVEMFCDRVAAAKIYQKKNYTDRSPLEYYKKGEMSRMIHPKTAQILEHFLLMLAKYGERKTFAYIRKCLKNKQ